MKSICRTSIALAAMLCQIQPAFSQAVTLDASGSKGPDGSPGASYSTHPGAGSGQNGGHAGPSSPGTDGRAIDIQLSEAMRDRGDRAVVQIVGTVAGRGTNQEVNLRPDLTLRTISRGGDGGSGGRGGDGQGGSNGSNGSNASQYSSAGNGGDGGRGGDGGTGTRGSNGGNGGVITIQLQADETYLSLLVAGDVSGGAAGGAGYNGQPGSGGRGGSGGSGATWSEKTGSHQECSDSLSSNGNGTSTVTRSCRTVDDYTTRSRPGGSSGSNGSSGRARPGDISPGQPGRSGSFEFVVGSNRYRKAFDLRIASYQFQELSPNGVFEPGEVVEVREMRIQNQSDMPWQPTKAKALLVLTNSAWTIAEPIELEIPAVGPMESVTLPGRYRFRIKDNTLPAAEGRMVVEDKIVPLGRVTRVEKHPDGLKLPKTLVISYPVEISKITSKAVSVSPGQSTDIFWSIKNISTKALGEKSPEARAITTAIQRWNPKNSEASQGGVTFNSQSIESSLVTGVALLEPGASFVVKGILKFDENHLPYTNVEIRTNATLKTIESDGKTREVQLRTLRYSIAQVFSGFKDAKWLLMTNGNTQRAEYLGWMKLANALGAKVDVWDVSYNASLSLLKALPKGGSLAELFAGKTIVLFNNRYPIHSRGEDSPFPIEQLFSNEVLQAANKNGTRFYIVGGDKSDGEKLFRNVHVDSAPEDRSNPISSTEILEAKTLSLEPNRVYNVTVDEKFLLAPNEKTFSARFESFKAKLQKRHPNERFLFYDAAAEVRERDQNFNRLYHLGQFRMMRSLERGTTGDLTWLPREREEMRQDSFSFGEENMKAMLLASNIVEKIRIARHLRSSHPEWSSLAINAVVLELAETLDIPRPNRKPLEQLQAWIKATSEPIDEVLATLWARAELYADKASSEDMDDEIESLEDVIKAKVKDKSAFKKQLKAEVKRLKNEASDRRDFLVGIDKQENFRRLYFLPLISRAVRTNHILTHGLLKRGE